MKSILKTALVGILLVAGTTKPVATLDDVKASLIGLIPDNQIVIDDALKANIGDLDISYPLWLCAQINRTLAKGKNTTDCTIRNGIIGNVLGYVRTIAVDYVDNTTTKLVVVTENGKTICGIQFTIAANGTVTATYKTDTDTTILLTKSYVQIENGFSPRQFANKYAAYTAGAVMAGVGLYYAWQWDKQTTINLLTKGFDERLAKLGFKATEQGGVVAQGFFDKALNAILRKLDSVAPAVGEAIPAAIPAAIPKA